NLPKYSEWTHLAFQLSLKCKIQFIDIQTFVNYLDTTGSLSKSKEWLISQPQFFKSLIQYKMPYDVRKKFRRKYAGLLHDASEMEMLDGNFSSAWVYHLRSICSGGLKYLPYSRHLIMRHFTRTT